MSVSLSLYQSSRCSLRHLLLYLLKVKKDPPLAQEKTTVLRRRMSNLLRLEGQEALEAQEVRWGLVVVEWVEIEEARA